MVVLGGLFITLSGGANVSAVGMAGIGGRPANPDPDNPRTQTVFMYTLKQGEDKKDVLFVNNGSDSRHTIELVAVDGTVANNGAYTCKQNVEPKNNVGSWISLSEKEITLDPRQSTLVDFTVTTPGGAEPGEHNGCITLQSKDDPGVAQGAITVKTRQAVRVAVTIPGDIHRAVTIDSFDVGERHIEKEGKRVWQQVFNIALKNTGNVSADTNVKIKLTNIFGQERYSNGGEYPVIANQTLKLSFTDENRPFWGGWYTATADIAYDKRAGTYGTRDESQLVYDKVGPVTVFVWPTLYAWISMAGIAMLVGVAIWWFRSGRKLNGRTKSGKRLWGSYVVKKGDTVESLSKKYDVGVDRIISMNKLSVDHKLKQGESIYLPRN